jgi:repressor LexA
MKEKPLSKRQKNILAFINTYIDEHGRPPTIREIGRNVEISSTSVVNYNLTRLNERGFLEREAEVSRGLAADGESCGSCRRGASSWLRLRRMPWSKTSEIVSTMVRVPLLGSIVAGEPIEVGNTDFATFDEDDVVEVSSSMLGSGQDGFFALRVSGESMIDAMVNDGDVVIMRQANQAQNGDMVAVWLSDDTTTLKYFYRDGEKIRLQPANPTMEPIYVHPTEVQVQGKVVMVLRQP